MNYSVCIEAVFNGKDFIESMETVKEVGISTIEFWGWWNKDIERVNIARQELDIKIAAFCTRFVSLVDPAQRAEYIDLLGQSIEVAKKLDCSNLITQVGNEIEGVPRGDQHKSIVEGLRECAPMLERENITLLVEPLNTLVDHKGYYLYSSKEAFDIIREVGSSSVKVLYDIYHQQIMEGNLIANIKENIDKIGHFHAAGNPGRHELNTGEIRYEEVFKSIKDTGYTGYIGLEYFPLDDPVKGLQELI